METFLSKSEVCLLMVPAQTETMCTCEWVEQQLLIT